MVCKYLSFSPSVPDQRLLHGVSQAARVYYNHTGQSRCLNTSQTATGSLGAIGWFYQVCRRGASVSPPLPAERKRVPNLSGPQACTEMVMPMCTDGVRDMFQPEEWNFQAFSDGCYARFGVRPRAEWAGAVYGGKDIAAHSNIIFR